MASVDELLGRIAPEIESEVRSRLAGFLGGMLRHYLPQTWVFRTDAGTASLSVDGHGSVTVRPGAASPADVTVDVTYDRLEAALSRRARAIAPEDRFDVTTHTAKGKAAFGFLRDRLGL